MTCGVILDSSVWLSQRLLRTPLGSSLLLFLRQSGGKLILPEVVELELRKNVDKLVEAAAAQASDGCRTFGQLTGKTPKLTLPEAQDATGNRTVELGALIDRVPFTLEDARSALSRVVEGTAPNGPKNQQFKDSAIWEVVLRMARTRPVHFVTKDKGFFENREPTRGLEEGLSQELRDAGSTVCAYFELADCLNAVRASAPELDMSVIVKAIEAAIEEPLAQAAQRRGLAVGKLIGSEPKVFVTERHDVLSVSCELLYEGRDLEGAPGRIERPHSGQGRLFLLGCRGEDERLALG